MRKKELIINKGQYLSDIYSIEPNTILCKTLTGLGATYTEIKAKRNSIIVEPNVPPIIGKCNDKKHKKDNLFAVKKDVSISSVAEYLSQTIKQKKYIKIICTPESFNYKVKQAFEEAELDMYTNCFMLMDECHKLVKDIDYREDIALPMKDFFMFKDKAMVSATPIVPSDPRFEEQHFTLIEVKPNYDYLKPITLVHTNNVLEAMRVTIEKRKKELESPRSLCLFINRTDMILQVIEKLGIKKDSVVFCSSNSTTKLNEAGIKAVENWNIKEQKPFMFFTSRFYAALDIELKVQPDIMFVTEPYLYEYTIIDPCTDTVQAIGRFRNGVSSTTHIVSTNKDFPIRDEKGINEYIKASEEAYNTILRLYDCAPSLEFRNAYKAALDQLPFKNKFMRYGEIDYFAQDNYRDEALVKSAYNNFDDLVKRYERAKQFYIVKGMPLYWKFGDKERLKLEKSSKYIKQFRKEAVDILESLKEDMDLPMVRYNIEELRSKDAFIVNAYETLGKEVIEKCNYNEKRIKEAIIMKDFEKKRNGQECVQLLKNSFKVNNKYERSFIKKELLRIFDMVRISPKEKVTGTYIKKFFDVKECKVRGKRAYLIVESLI